MKASSTTAWALLIYVSVIITLSCQHEFKKLPQDNDNTAFISQTLPNIQLHGRDEPDTLVESHSTVAINTTPVDSKLNLPEINTSLKDHVREKRQIKKPIITFDSVIHHLQNISFGEKFSHKFNFRNTGTAPLIINETSASCGCTMASYPFLEILPGELGYIGVEYNSVGKIGLQEPEITVNSNAVEGDIKLIMKFRIVE